MQSGEHSRKYLEARVRYLEEMTRFTMDALETAASLGDFQASINKLQDPSIILDETRTRIERLIHFEATAFFLVEEENSDFYLASGHPSYYKSYIQDEIDALIDDGTFGWALRGNRPVIVPTRDHEKQLILHTMVTSSRTRGMFAGLVNRGKMDIPDISLSLLSIILLNSSNALESFELYCMIRKITENLEKDENYKVLFEAAPDGVEVLDARGNIVDCNQAYQNLVQCPREKIVGCHTSSFFAEPYKALHERHLAILKQTGFFEGEMELTTASGSSVPVWRKEKAIFGEPDELVGSVVYNHDMSSIKSAEEQRESLEAQLQRAQKMEALGTLAGGVAHDLNNILGGLVSYPELLLAQVPQDSLLRKPLLTIQKSGEKAAAIVQDLLTLARRGVSTTEVVNLNDIIRDYLKTPEHERLRSLYPGVVFETRYAIDLLNIKGSPIHLSKSVMNLISNALEAIQDTGRIIISTENRYIDHPIQGYDDLKEGDYVMLSITDSGVGISGEDINRIFEPFYTRKVMGRSGTGLGLAVVWGTVKDHGGYIDVQSAGGKGTTFKLYFPVAREDIRTVRTIPIDAYRGHGEKVLVVDDMEEQREVAAQMLQNLGYSVASVSSGEEAVEYMKHRSADLLVLDMIMHPGMDGLDTYKAIIELHPGQRAILVSGYSETERVQQAQRLGAGAYVRKPFLFETIGLAVKAELTK